MSKQGINAAAWMAQQSFAGRIEVPAAQPPKPRTHVVEQWDGQRWIEVVIEEADNA